MAAYKAKVSLSVCSKVGLFFWPAAAVALVFVFVAVLFGADPDKANTSAAKFVWRFGFKKRVHVKWQH